MSLCRFMQVQGAAGQCMMQYLSSAGSECTEEEEEKRVEEQY
jgi:hypothetical protein